MVVRTLRRLRACLPAGARITDPEWDQRHRVILGVLAAHVVGVVGFAALRGQPPQHSIAEALPLVAAAWLATRRWLGRRLRAGFATLGLLLASAALVHLSGGVTAVHFHFFVMLFVITFYQDWLTFLLAIAFILLHHTVVGTLAPASVFDTEQARRDPLAWAGLHALFILAAGVAALANWRLAEKAQAGERQLAERLAYQASHDALTGALNRHEFERCMTAALVKCRTQHQEHAFFLIDLDRFKVVNDTVGHPAGDALLRELTALLRSHLRGADSLARLGGDEFAVLLEACPLDRAVTIAEDIRQAVADHRFEWDQHIFHVGASIGVVPVTPAASSLDEVMQAADNACYAAKDNGRNRVHVYRPGDDDFIRRQGESHWIGRLLTALAEDRLELYYQPIVATDPAAGTPQRRFGELLVRLHDEDGSMLPAASFLPAAERHGLMAAIDRWVVTAACTALAGRYPLGAQHTDLFSINLSGATLSDSTFAAFVRGCLAEHGIPPEIFCFEVAETVAIGNLRATLDLLTELRQAGCRVALDDFGAGLSSFTYLRNLSLDYIKIDGEFVRNVTRNPIDRSTVEAVAHIGRGIGVQTIGAFVETAEVRDQLAGLGVDYAQGWAISRPSPLAASLPPPGPAPAAPAAPATPAVISPATQTSPA